MACRKVDSPISLFSFQDIIMSVVGIVILITLILLLQLVSQMLAAPFSPVLTEYELKQQMDSMQQELQELQNSIAELNRFREESQIFTPSQDKVESLQMTVERLESDIALSEKEIMDIQKHIDYLRNSPATLQLERVQQEIEVTTEELAELKRQANTVSQSESALMIKIQELKMKNTDLDKQIADSAPVQIKLTLPTNSDKTAFILDYGKDGIRVIPTDGSSEQVFTSYPQFSNWVVRRDYRNDHFVVYLRPSRFGYLSENIVRNLRARGFDVGLQVIGEDSPLSFSP